MPKKKKEETLTTKEETSVAELSKRAEKLLAKVNSTNVWGLSERGIIAKELSRKYSASKHGMSARVPIMCGKSQCPYSASCILLQNDLAPYGEPCPMEVAYIENAYERYDEDFNVENSSYVDRATVDEIINLDVMIQRAKALMSQETIQIQDTVVGTTEDGDVITRPEISRAFELYERCLTRRNSLYQLMAATRKDKIKDGGGEVIDIGEFIENTLNIDSNKGFVIEERPEQFIDTDN